MPTEREMGLVQNKSLAEWNLSQEPKIEEAKKRLRNTYEEAVKVKEKVMELKEKLSEFAAIFSFLFQKYLIFVCYSLTAC